MISKTINPLQFTLEFDAALTERYACVRDVVATGVYQRGLKRVAADLDKAPGNLSVELSDEPTRHFSVDSLERYLVATGDMTPIHYLVAKYIGDRGATERAELEQVKNALQALAPALKRMGL
jgi:hypothetical protein